MHLMASDSSTIAEMFRRRVALDGELEAVLGDEVVTVKEGQTVLAPPGVKHGFVNRSGASARPSRPAQVAACR